MQPVTLFTTSVVQFESGRAKSSKRHHRLVHVKNCISFIRGSVLDYRKLLLLFRMRSSTWTGYDKQIRGIQHTIPLPRCSRQQHLLLWDLRVYVLMMVDRWWVSLIREQVCPGLESPTEVIEHQTLWMLYRSNNTHTNQMQMSSSNSCSWFRNFRVWCITYICTLTCHSCIRCTMVYVMSQYSHGKVHTYVHTLHICMHE